MPNDGQRQDPVEPQITDTLEKPETPPTTDDGNGGQQAISEPKSNDLDDREIQRLKREAGKLKQTQEELKEMQTRFKTVEQWIAKDPDMYKKALMDTSGMTEEAATNYIKQYNPDYGSKSQGGQPTTSTQPIQPPVDPITQYATQELIEDKRRDIQDRVTAIKEFEDEHSDLSYEEKSTIANAASVYIRKYNMPIREAINLAYKRNFQADDLIKEAEEKGELKGLAALSAVNSSTFRAPSGAQPQGSEPQPYVSNSEWQEAQSRGFKSKAEYVSYRDNSIVTVN